MVVRGLKRVDAVKEPGGNFFAPLLSLWKKLWKTGKKLL
jgi:hypothetical protein